jgi:uncharacterized alpha-E superfamily protein
MERADSTARLLRVHSGLLLDAALPPERTWRPLLIVLGEEPRFHERFGARREAEGEVVQEYLAWDQESPVSIANTLRTARETARTIRETVSLEMWEALNSSWIWLSGGAGRRLYNRERLAFYEEVMRRCHQFQGACQSTMLHEEPFDFMRLGLNLERAGQTARVLDLQHHAFGPRGKDPESAVHAAEWIAILRSCAAYEPFFKQGSAPLSGPAVAEFLLLHPALPSSVSHSIARAWNFVERIRGREPGLLGGKSARALGDLRSDVAGLDMDGIMREGIHEVLTWIVDRTAEVSLAVEDDYFSSAFPVPSNRRPEPFLQD